MKTQIQNWKHELEFKNTSWRSKVKVWKLEHEFKIKNIQKKFRIKSASASTS